MAKLCTHQTGAGQGAVHISAPLGLEGLNEAGLCMSEEQKGAGAFPVQRGNTVNALRKAELHRPGSRRARAAYSSGVGRVQGRRKLVARGVRLCKGGGWS